VSSPVLSLRALNRATLARQFLVRRSDESAETVVAHLVGMQSQAPSPPYVGLWTRMAGFAPEELSQLLLDRRVVRIALMRSTVHLVTASDCVAFRPIFSPVLLRGLMANAEYRAALAGLDIDSVVTAGRALLDHHPLTPKQLGEQLAAQWPEVPPGGLAYAMRCAAALVQVPPRGLWGRAGQTTYATAESWLGRPLAVDTEPDAVILRYLAAFGPATVADAQVWSGLARLGEVFERLRPGLRTFRDDAGRELFDVREGELPDPDTPVPVRYLPEYDNLLLSHADRSRVISAEDRPRIMTVNGIIPGTVLIDGFARALWKVTRQRRAATLSITPFRALSKKSTASVTTEGARLLRFLAPGDGHQVTIAAPG
jgi:hypothetical protein